MAARTVCGSQPSRCPISATVAPSGRSSRPISCARFVVAGGSSGLLTPVVRKSACSAESAPRLSRCLHHHEPGARETRRAATNGEAIDTHTAMLALAVKSSGIGAGQRLFDCAGSIERLDCILITDRAADLYGAFPVKRLLLGFAHSSLFGAGKAFLHPVACDPVPGARGRGQGAETLAELGGLPPSVACVSQRLDA